MTAKTAISKYIAHQKEGALTFKNEVSLGTKAPDFELKIPAWHAIIRIPQQGLCGARIWQHYLRIHRQAASAPEIRVSGLFIENTRNGFEFF